MFYKKAKAIAMKKLTFWFSVLLTLFFTHESWGQNKRFLTFYATREGLVGHAFVSFIREDPTLKMTIIDGCWGFYPKNRIPGGASFFIGSVEGEIRNDIKTQREIGLTIEVNKCEYDHAISIKNKWATTRYELTVKDCVSFVMEIAQSLPGKLILPQRATFDRPHAYIEELKILNSKNNIGKSGNSQMSNQKINEGCNSFPTLFLFDLSGSMSERGASNLPKIEEAKGAAKATLQTISNANGRGVTQEVGILAFSGGCTTDPTYAITNGFSTDMAVVENAINKIPSPGGGTPLFEAIQASRQKLEQHLDNTGAEKAKLIILSDGQATCKSIRPNDVYAFGQAGQVTQTISSASQSGLVSTNVRYYTVGFNIAPGSPAERDLQYLAQISGGKYLNAQNQFELTKAFQKFNRIFIPKPKPELSEIPVSSREVFDRGVSTITAEDYPTALDSYKTYVQQHPEDCHGVYNLALMLEANEYYKAAIAHYEKYIQLCPGAEDESYVRKQIDILRQDYEAYLIFNRKVIMSDMEYLDLHFKKIQNGQSIALATEFIAFIKEKWAYYQNLPAILEINSRPFETTSKEVFRGLSSCVDTIKRNPQTWDRDATPVLSRTYISMERLLQLF